MNNCFYLPKELMDDNYKLYSIETKMLFAILLSSSQSAKSISNVAKLIEDIGNTKINAMCKDLKISMRKEGA